MSLSPNQCAVSVHLVTGGVDVGLVLRLLPRSIRFGLIRMDLNVFDVLDG